MNVYIAELWHEAGVSAVGNATYVARVRETHRIFPDLVKAARLEVLGMYHLDPQHRSYFVFSADRIEDVSEALLAAGWMGWCDGRVYPTRPFGSRVASLKNSAAPQLVTKSQDRSAADRKLYLVELWHEVGISALANAAYVPVTEDSLRLLPENLASHDAELKFAYELAPSTKSVLMFWAGCVEDVRSILYKSRLMHWNDGQIFPVSELNQLSRTLAGLSPAVTTSAQPLAVPRKD